MLSNEINFIFKIFDKNVIVHVNIFLFNDKYKVILKKNYFVLFKSVAKINASIFDFKKIFASIAKNAKIRNENKNNTNIVDLIKTHKSINFFLNNQMKFGIKNFENIDEVAIVINMHFLLKNLFSNIEFITIFIVFNNVKKLFKQTKQKRKNKYELNYKLILIDLSNSLSYNCC